MPLPVNLFEDVPPRSTEEVIQTILAAGDCRLERIVSHGHRSPDNFWYDQDRSEWVMVMQGAAQLRFEDEDRLIELRPGDALDIPAHRRHRVEWTTPEEPTIWLALHYGPSNISPLSTSDRGV